VFRGRYRYRRVPVLPVPGWSRVDPLGEVLISEFPEGLVAAFGLPIAPGFAWPVVVPGGLPDGGTPVADELPPEDAPLGLPPAPAANAIELDSAKAPANAIVANFMGRFPCCCSGGNRRRRFQFPHRLLNIAVNRAGNRVAGARNMGPASIARLFGERRHHFHPP
jgi:hypothetical protein